MRQSSLAMLLLCSIAAVVTAEQIVYMVDEADTDSTPRTRPKLHGRFLHITDMHPDPNYLYNATVTSSCHKLEEKDGDHVGTLTRARHRHGDTDDKHAGYWGTAATDCDSPWVLVDETFKHLKENWADKIDFIIWTGDNARHDNDNEIPRSLNAILDLNREIVERFLDTFPPSKPDNPNKQPKRIPIVPSIGNNDIYPHNILEAGPNRITNMYSQIWEPFIPEEQFHVFHRGGYYIAPAIPHHLAIISLNTIYWYDSNKAVDGCEKKSPGREEFKWLRIQLRQLRKKGMKAYLTGHVPPAYKSYYEDCWNMYGEIALDFQDVIIGHLYGHANMDHFFFFDKDDVKGEKKEKFNVRDRRRILQNAQRHETGSSCLDSFDDARCLGDFGLESEHEYVSGKGHIGIQSYVDDIYDDYKQIAEHKEWNLDNFALINVAPSVIPTYYPSMRIFEYNVTELEEGVKPATEVDDEDDEDDEDDDDDDEDVDDNSDPDSSLKKKKKKHKKKKNKKDRKPDPSSPSRMNTYLTPLKFTQYYCNITQANIDYEKHSKRNHSLQWDVEYATDDKTLKMPDLTINSWLEVAKRAANDDKLWKQLQTWMRVSTPEGEA